MPPRTVLALAFVLGLLPLSVHAQEVSPEDQAACQFDAQNYCQEAIPDHARVRACLLKNRRVISPACRQAIERKPARKRPGRR